LGLSAFKFLWWAQTREITRNSDRILPYRSSRSSKVIDLGVNRKPICDFLLVINSDVNKDSRLKAKDRTKDLRLKAKARTKDPTFKAKARTKDLKHTAKDRTKDQIKDLLHVQAQIQKSAQNFAVIYTCY